MIILKFLVKFKENILKNFENFCKFMKKFIRIWQLY